MKKQGLFEDMRNDQQDIEARTITTCSQNSANKQDFDISRGSQAEIMQCHTLQENEIIRINEKWMA